MWVNLESYCQIQKSLSLSYAYIDFCKWEISTRLLYPMKHLSSYIACIGYILAQNYTCLFPPFQDYLLLNAPLHNSSEPPLLSVVVPMDSGKSAS